MVIVKSLLSAVRAAAIRAPHSGLPLTVGLNSRKPPL